MIGVIKPVDPGHRKPDRDSLSYGKPPKRAPHGNDYPQPEKGIQKIEQLLPNVILPVESRIRKPHDHGRTGG